MTKRDQRWPIWKIAVTAAALVLGAAVLFVLSIVAAPLADSPEGATQRPMLTVPTFLVMIGGAVSILAVLSIGWLIYRIHESRIPVWERKKPRKRRRRR